MITIENNKKIPPLLSVEEIANILGDGIWLFESNPYKDSDGTIRYFLIIEVMGSSIYDIGYDHGDIDSDKLKLGGLARECFSEI